MRRNNAHRDEAKRSGPNGTHASRQPRGSSKGPSRRRWSRRPGRRGGSRPRCYPLDPARTDHQGMGPATGVRTARPAGWQPSGLEVARIADLGHVGQQEGLARPGASAGSSCRNSCSPRDCTRVSSPCHSSEAPSLLRKTKNSSPHNGGNRCRCRAFVQFQGRQRLPPLWGLEFFGLPEKGRELRRSGTAKTLGCNP